MNTGISRDLRMCLGSALAACLCAGAADHAYAQHDLHQLTVDYQSQRQRLVLEFHQQRKWLLIQHQTELEQLRLAELNAVRLCGEARRAAVQQLVWRRREAVERYAIQVRELERQFHQSLIQLDAWFRSARQTVVTYRVPTAPGPGHPLIHAGPPGGCAHRDGFTNSGFSFSIGREGLRIGVSAGGGSRRW